MSRKVVLSPDEYYHIYNRGTEKRKIFLDKKDYERFAALLYMCNSADPVHMSVQSSGLENIFATKRGVPLVAIGAYCIMPNHIHILIKERDGNGTSRFMQKLMTAYTMYFNIKYERTGALFQGRFKARHANTDEYLKYLFAYIHLNAADLPLPQLKKSQDQTHKRKLIDALRKYSFSSYQDYCDTQRPEGNILEKDVFPNYFKQSFQGSTLKRSHGDMENFEDVMLEWLSYRENEGFKVQP